MLINYVRPIFKTCNIDKNITYCTDVNTIGTILPTYYQRITILFQKQV